MVPSDLEVAYIAGFFDGEGHIGLRSGRGQKGGQSFKACVSQNDTSVLEWIQTFFGGGIYTNRSCAQLEITGFKAITFLEAILPYLRVKKDSVTYSLYCWNRRHEGREVLDELWEARTWKKVHDGIRWQSARAAHST